MPKLAGRLERSPVWPEKRVYAWEMEQKVGSSQACQCQAREPTSVGGAALSLPTRCTDPRGLEGIGELIIMMATDINSPSASTSHELSHLTLTIILGSRS